MKPTSKIARVFPTRTAATPNDELAFWDVPPMLALPEIDEVHISVSFSWDMARAEWLAKQWEQVGVPVIIGGPTFNEPSSEFIPGKYLKDGYTITSRGCPNRCWFCSVWKREPEMKELVIRDGWNLLDDNILACSEKHLTEVFAMLKRQKHQAEFTGGLEAALLTRRHVEMLKDLNPAQMFFAYDTPDDLEPLIAASALLDEAEFTRNKRRCYVLIGHPKDTMDDAERRLQKAWSLGFLPFAMLWRNESGGRNQDWMKFQKLWARPAIIKSRMKKFQALERTTDL